MDPNRKIWPPFQVPTWMGESTVDPQVRIARARQRAREVIAWFEHNLTSNNLALATRPEPLTPEWEAKIPTFELMCRRLHELVVDSLCSKRTSLVSTLPATSMKGVRFLVYDAEEEVADGSSECSSSGLFDVHDEPGWATWIDHYRDYETGHRLLCCVPPALEDATQAGIDANPVDCIRWIDCPEPLGDPKR